MMVDLRRRRLLYFIVFLVVAAAAAWWAAPFFSTPPPAPSGDSSDPRLLYNGPFRNIHPDVAYAGDSACVSCHADISQSFRHHPMGRSLTPIVNANETQWYDTAHHNPFTALGATFEVEQRDRRVWHKETRPDEAGQPVDTFRAEVSYALGSGTRGRSYLSNRDGYLFQTAISWYAQKQVWDLSPGFGPENLSGRPISGMCLYCHANRTQFQEGSINRYDPPVFEGHAIGCERCHGPGQKHVQSGDRFDIVAPNLKNLTPELCDSVCEQCHLEGVQRIVRRHRKLYDFRPGLPLQDFWRIFVRPHKPGSKYEAVTHFEQMQLSRCYPGRPGKGRMLCISCHDPHVAVAGKERVAYYRNRCLECHRDKGCSVPIAARLQQSEDSCIACHMPRLPTADIVHTAATDHRILRRPAPALQAPSHSAAEDDPELEPFHPYEVEEQAEVHRDLGLALVEMMRSHEASPERVSGRAESFLADAVRRDPEDAPAGEALGLTLIMRHRGPEAWAALDNVLRREPNREVALTAAATLLWNMGRTEESLTYWRRAIAVNPWLPTYRRSLMKALLSLRRRDEARTACLNWLRMDPMSAEARRVWNRQFARNDSPEP